MFANARFYNAAESIFFKLANKLEDKLEAYRGSARSAGLGMIDCGKPTNSSSGDCCKSGPCDSMSC